MPKVHGGTSIGISGDSGCHLSSRSVLRDFKDDECQQFVTNGNCTSAERVLARAGLTAL